MKPTIPLQVTATFIKPTQTRHSLTQVLKLGLVVASALIIWKGLMCITGSESPVVVMLSGSMEPAFQRGDILFLHMNTDPIRAGEIIVFKVNGKPIPIVHRVIEVHEHRRTREVDILTKGDNNDMDDRVGLVYSHGQQWVQRDHVMGRVIGYVPYAGWATLIMTGNPVIKYILIGGLCLVAIWSKEQERKSSEFYGFKSFQLCSAAVKQSIGKKINGVQ